MGLRSYALALTLWISLTSCADDEFVDRTDAADPPPAGPFGALPVGQDIRSPDLTGVVHAARDRYGIMHISAENIRDLGFAQGYVMGHDRLPQMDILRRFGDGTLGELFGAVDQGTVETDLEMRVHRMRPLAEEALGILRASTDPRDVEIVQMLEGFAAGVNAANADYASGKYPIDPAVAATYSPTTFRPWSPVDSLVLGRFQAFALSYTAPLEVTLTEVYDAARTTFDNASAADAAAFARRGISRDLLLITPVGREATIDGFPNVVSDTGTRSDAGRPGMFARVLRAPFDSVSLRETALRANGRTNGKQKRPAVPRELLRNARAFFAPSMAQGPHAFMAPRAGSNAWAIGPSVAGDGKAMLAGDQHLSLPNPSIFYPVHLIVPGQIDAFGQTFPGIPGIILGTNGKAAWSSTVVYHDVNDVFLETIVPCTAGGGDCVQHDGGQVPIETWTETVRLGALGTITGQITATYERVPHHGPIIPTVQDGMIVPRTADRALSVQYTGYAPTLEIRAIWELVRADTVDAGFRALRHFEYGGQNWVLIDNQANIGWTTNAKVPTRKPAAYTWNATSNPTGLSPFLVQPGDGSADWDGFLSSRYIPHAINPASGMLVTANSDPVGETFDGDPLDGPAADGRPLYVGTTYAAGVRTERIDELTRAPSNAGAWDFTKLASVQHDARSNMGYHLRDTLVTALGFVDDATGAPADVAPYLASLSTAQRTRLQQARAKLQAWTLGTPPALAASAPQAEIDDSIATAIFNVWMHYVIEQTLGDEFAAIAMSPWDLDQNLLARIVQAMLVEPAGMVLSPATNQPILCDEMSTAGTDASCTKKILEAALAALVQLDTLMGSADMGAWRWGKLHTLTLRPLFPDARLEVPAPGSAQAGGFPKPGDNFAVNRADCGWGDLDFKQDEDGPAQRFLAEARPGQQIEVKLQFPGGTIYNPSNPHYKDVLENHYIAERHFDLPFTTDEIVAAGEERWVLRR
ncbi:MAG: penicillin acylase family protein [Deltaproteobacteria bacterium]|nr:penicillin acylase family protein [Kofleriaceae bacterium]